MSLLFWGMLLRVFGEVLVVLAVLHMHHSLIKEHRIDRKVILSYRQERILTFIALICIAVGYMLEVLFYTPTPLFTCQGVDCTAAAGSVLYSQ